MFPFSRFTRYFLEVAQQRSIRRAAEVLHVSASAIDRQVLSAERALGVPLFERLPGGLRLTSAGELLLANARQWQKDFARTCEQVDEMQGLRRGHVDIGLIDALSEGLVVEAVAGLMQRYPGLTFGMKVADNQQVAQMLASAEVDFGFMLDAVASPELVLHASTEIKVGIAMPTGHPLASKKRLRLSETQHETVIFPAAPLVVHKHVHALYQHLQLDARQRVACNDLRMMRSLIRQGVGVGMLSWLDVASEVQAGAIAFVPLSGIHVSHPVLSLCVAAHRQLPKAALLAMADMRERMAQLGSGP
ncbi:LysR family transcriptional regulator [Pseudomonas typographi]|uniref:LysR family transcriptional regulator n=1 Tax=Pseudomonas typographi TaxID=2715964 RepID=A0ABR7Z0W6_9PSED|nr:LysR family transcriptional regulator [Pseudomonas typographi]MBD1552275.1 LysR family transcriptional regulator [Pseudomonas typographi]MBD1587395.1 LysR family transcriptional regulator [Pseudomonas typographi]MBD1599110.1 LysR family transcriptional regulator [Pseudomonas typographi]